MTRLDRNVTIGTTCAGTIWTAYADRHTAEDVAIMAGRIVKFGGTVSAEARAVLGEAAADTAEAPCNLDEVLRVRGLTAAQARWLTDPIMGHNNVYSLDAGRTWVEGTRAQLQLAVDALDATADGMAGVEIATAADDTAAEMLPEHLRESWTERTILRTLRCIASASAKVDSVLQGRTVKPERVTAGHVQHTLAGI